FISHALLGAPSRRADRRCDSPRTPTRGSGGDPAARPLPTSRPGRPPARGWPRPPCRIRHLSLSATTRLNITELRAPHLAPPPDRKAGRPPSLRSSSFSTGSGAPLRPGVQVVWTRWEVLQTEGRRTLAADRAGAGGR